MEKQSNETFLFGMAFGLGLSTLVYLFWDSIVKADFRYVAAPTIAFLALCLAGYSARKVVEWQDSKMNDSKYQVIEEIIDIKIEIKIALMRVGNIIKINREKNKIINRDDLVEQQQKLHENIDSLSIKMTKADVLGFPPEYYNEDIPELMNGYQALTILVGMMKSENKITIESYDDLSHLQPLEKLVNSLVEKIDKTSNIELIKMNSIINNVTSPSYKDQ